MRRRRSKVIIQANDELRFYRHRRPLLLPSRTEQAQRAARRASHLQFVRFFFFSHKEFIFIVAARAHRDRLGRDTRFCLLRPSSTLVSETFAPSLPGESASPFHLALSHHGGGIEGSIKWD